MSAPWKKSYDQPRQHIKKQRHYFAYKGLSSQGYGFSSSHVWMWELDYKESWLLKNWRFWTVVLERTLESPLDYKEIQPVHPKGNQSWIFFGRTDAEAETQYSGHLMWRTLSFSLVAKSCPTLVTPWTAATQASLSFTIFQSLLKLMSIESVMPSYHLIFCHPLLLPPSIFPSIRVFSNELLFTSGSQSMGAGVSASASVLPMNIQGWFSLGLTGLISLQSEELSRVISSTIQAHQFIGA